MCVREHCKWASTVQAVGSVWGAYTRLGVCNHSLIPVEASLLRRGLGSG